MRLSAIAWYFFLPTLNFYPLSLLRSFSLKFHIDFKIRMFIPKNPQADILINILRKTTIFNQFFSLSFEPIYLNQFFCKFQDILSQISYKKSTDTLLSHHFVPNIEILEKTYYNNTFTNIKGQLFDYLKFKWTLSLSCSQSNCLQRKLKLYLT